MRFCLARGGSVLGAWVGERWSVKRQGGGARWSLTMSATVCWCRYVSVCLVI